MDVLNPKTNELEAFIYGVFSISSYVYILKHYCVLGNITISYVLGYICERDRVLICRMNEHLKNNNEMLSTQTNLSLSL